MTRDIVIVGHGGLAREVSFILEGINQAQPTWTVRGFLASGAEDIGQQVGRYPVFATDDWLLHRREQVACVIGIGNQRLVAALYSRFRTNPNISFPTLVHPSVTGDWERVALGEGNIILNGVSLTTDISLGNFNTINPGCTLAHDCKLGNNNLLGPGVHLGGAVTVGNRVLLGVGSCVLPGVRIADDVVIGAGGAVIHDIEDPGTYVGVPVRQVPKNR